MQRGPAPAKSGAAGGDWGGEELPGQQVTFGIPKHYLLSSVQRVVVFDF